MARPPLDIADVIRKYGPHPNFEPPGGWDKAAERPPDKLVKASNHIVAQRAHKYVYGTDDRQLRFVENRLGKTSVQLIGDAVLTRMESR